MNRTAAKVWIVISALAMASVMLIVVERDIDRLRGAWTAAAMAVLFGVVFLTMEAMRAIGNVPPQTLTSKAIVRPNPSPTWGWWPILYDRTLFLTVGPVQEQTTPAVPGWKWHRPTRKANMALILTDSQQVSLSIAGGDDKKGNPATLPPGVPTWTVSDPKLLSITPSADGLSAVVGAVGPLGTAQAQVALGGLTGVLDIQITAGTATSVLVTAGTPTEQGA